MVGNKTDLSRQVSTQEGMAFAAEIKSVLFEVSAKTGDNIKILFDAIARKGIAATESSIHV